MPLSLARATFGYLAFIPIMLEVHVIVPLPVYGFFCYIIFKFLFGWSDGLWDRRYRSRDFIFSPVYVSSALMLWWLGKTGFSGWGCIFRDSRTGEKTEMQSEIAAQEDQNAEKTTDIDPWFTPGGVPPLMVIVPGKDNLVNPFKLVQRFNNVETKSYNGQTPAIEIMSVIEVASYSHLDPLWAIDAIETFARQMKQFIWAHRDCGVQTEVPEGCEEL